MLSSSCERFFNDTRRIWSSFHGTSQCTDKVRHPLDRGFIRDH